MAPKRAGGLLKAMTMSPRKSLSLSFPKTQPEVDESKGKGKQRANSCFNNDDDTDHNDHHISSIPYTSNSHASTSSTDLDSFTDHSHPSPRLMSSSLQSKLAEALNTPLPPAQSTSTSNPSPSIDRDSNNRSSYFFISPTIPRPAAAHHPNTPDHLERPRLLSHLTRTTLPTASLSHASTGRRVASLGGSLELFRGNRGRGRGREKVVEMKRGGQRQAEEDFPDLDPTSGLPLGEQKQSISSSSSAPSLHLQQTISDLLTWRRQSLDQTNTSPRSLLSSSSWSLHSPETKRQFSTTQPKSNGWTSWASSWWSGHKDRVDEMMAEEDQASTVDEEQANLRKKYKTPQYPLVFCHGLLGFDYIGPASLPPLQISHWRGIREVLESNGAEVMIARVPATSSIQDRATILEELVAEKFPNQKVNLIAHSMGGLDCRYLISQLKPRFKVVSLTTISTPHRGSPFADYVIDNVIGRDRLPQLLSVMEAMRLPNSGDGSAFKALGTKAMKEFNSQVIDMDDVRYFSWGASFDPGILDTFRWPHSIILAKEGPNDGLVSVHSAMWGEYQGTLVGVNHLDLVGWVNHVRYVISGWTGNPITFKPATFYLEVSDFLAKQGF